MEFIFKIEEKPEVCILHFSGNLIEKSQALEMLERFEELLSKDIKKFIIDMYGFTYMNSTGLNVLLTILTRSRKAGGETIVCSVPENIKSLMLITRLNNIFTVAKNQKEAEKFLMKEVG